MLLQLGFLHEVGGLNQCFEVVTLCVGVVKDYLWDIVFIIELCDFLFFIKLCVLVLVVELTMHFSEKIPLFLTDLGLGQLLSL